MKDFELKQLRQQSETIKQQLNSILAFTKSISERIESGKYIPEGEAEEICEKLEEYSDSFQLMKTRLGLVNIEFKEEDGVAGVEAALERESRRSQEILNYLKLVSSYENAVEQLEKTKYRLIELVQSGEDNSAGLEPYALVVESVTGKTELDDAGYELIKDSLGTSVARAADRGQLEIDETLDTEKYGQIPQVAETASDRPEEISKEKTAKESTDQSKETSSVSLPGMFQKLYPPQDIRLEIQDFPAGDLVSSKFISELKADAANGYKMLRAMCMTEAEIIITPRASSVNYRAGVVLPELETCEKLVELGYFSKGTLSLNGVARSFYMLSSKGQACFFRKDTCLAMNDISDEDGSSWYPRNPETEKLVVRNNGIAPKKLTPRQAYEFMLLRDACSTTDATTDPIIGYRLSDRVDVSDGGKIIWVALDGKGKSFYTCIADENETPEHLAGRIATRLNAMDLCPGDRLFVVPGACQNCGITDFNGKIASINISLPVATVNSELNMFDADGFASGGGDKESKIKYWSQLCNVSDEEAKLIPTLPAGLNVSIFASPAASNRFNAKDFKRRVSSSPRMSELFQILQAVQKLGPASARHIWLEHFAIAGADSSKCSDKDYTEFEADISTLLDYGYLRKISLEYCGDMLNAYELSELGRQLFTTKETASYIGVRRISAEKMPPLWELDPKNACVFYSYLRAESENVLSTSSLMPTGSINDKDSGFAYILSGLDGSEEIAMSMTVLDRDIPHMISSAHICVCSGNSFNPTILVEVSLSPATPPEFEKMMEALKDRVNFLNDLFNNDLLSEYNIECTQRICLLVSAPTLFQARYFAGAISLYLELVNDLSIGSVDSFAFSYEGGSPALYQRMISLDDEDAPEDSVTTIFDEIDAEDYPDILADIIRSGDETIDELEAGSQSRFEEPLEEDAEEDDNREDDEDSGISYMQSVNEMLETGNNACAAAYLRALAVTGNAEAAADSEKLSYAIGVPGAGCVYESQKLIELFLSNPEPADFYMACSAMLRCLYLDDCRYDYNMQPLISGISALSDNDEYDIFPKISGLAMELAEFKEKYRKGFDFYADYRSLDRAARESKIKNICAEALDMYQRNVTGKRIENANHKRFIETKRILFQPESDLATCLKIVADNDSSQLEILNMYIAPHIKEDCEICSANIIPAQIDAIIDDAWDKAGNFIMCVHHNSNLMSSLRTNVYLLVKRSLSLIADYISAKNESRISDGDRGLKEYRRCRDHLVSEINSIEESIYGNVSQIGVDDSRIGVGLCALRNTAVELRFRITGSYNAEMNEKYYYWCFLYSDDVILNENFEPEFYTFPDLDGMSPDKRILNYFRIWSKNNLDTPADGRLTLATRLEQIIGGVDNYGTAFLIRAYADAHPDDSELQNLISAEDLEKAEQFPAKALDTKLTKFSEFLDLAQSYGQIDPERLDIKESILQTVQEWADITRETRNYGFFNRIVDAYTEKIKEDAKARAVTLMIQVEEYKAANPDWKKNPAVGDALNIITGRITDQKYTAAEDLLNRLLTDDNIEEGISVTGEADILAEYIGEHAELYAKTNDCNITLRNSVNLGRIRNHDTRGAEKLLDSWPSGKGATAGKIKELLSSLGFAVSENSVTKGADINSCDTYDVRLSVPQSGKKSSYRHPIYIFGSEGVNKGFRIVAVYNRMEPAKLAQMFDGLLKNTIVLLNHPLTLPDKRELARLCKQQYNGQTFAVIDRVTMAFLATRYGSLNVNKALMDIIMPFAACQPYISDSFRTMPPEIFTGRREELEQIENAAGVNILYGGRQLGKSALLKMAKDDTDRNENGDRAVYVDIKDLDFRNACRKISETLYDEGFLPKQNITKDWNVLARDIKNRLRDTSPEKYVPYFLLLIDEADEMFRTAEAENYSCLNALKDIASVGSDRFKFVAAGLRNLIRFNKAAALGNNSVLAHFKTLAIKPFRAEEALQLIVEPLTCLGYRFADDAKTDALLATILSTTNYYPGLIQSYCEKLVGAMKQGYGGFGEAESPPYAVRESLLQKVLSDPALLEDIRNKFEITLRVGDDNYYYLIALLIAYRRYMGLEGPASAGDILEMAKSYDIEKIAALTSEQIRALMDEMCSLNVLLTVDGSSYRFARQTYMAYMGTKTEVEDALLREAEATA